MLKINLLNIVANVTLSALISGVQANAMIDTKVRKPGYAP